MFIADDYAVSSKDLALKLMVFPLEGQWTSEDGHNDYDDNNDDGDDETKQLTSNK